MMPQEIHLCVFSSAVFHIKIQVAHTLRQLCQFQNGARQLARQNPYNDRPYNQSRQTYLREKPVGKFHALPDRLQSSSRHKCFSPL